MRSRDSSVDIATGYGWTAGVRFSLHRVQIGSEPHPAYSTGTGGSLPGSKAAEEWSWLYSPPSSTEAKNGEAVPPLAHTSSRRTA
jgi:hypothetical protein